MDKSEIIQKWIEGTLSDEERARFEQSEEFSSISEISDQIADLKAPEYDVEEELSKLRSKLKPKEAKKIAISQLALRIAALVVAVISLGYFLLNKGTPQFKEISSEVNTEVELPDNSEVKLNAKSSVAFDPYGWDRNRKLNLTGEAYFRVAKGTTFEVKTASGTIQVIGTSFNVKDRDGVLEVSCYTGQVRVANEKGQVLLSKSEKVTFTKSTVGEKTSISSSSPSWIEGKSAFQSTPLVLVLKEFERQFDVTFKYEGIDSTMLFTGTFSNTDLKIGLESITLPLHLSYQITENQIALSKSTQ